MPFGAHILGSLEDALSEGFAYHSQLNSFFLRSGIRQEVIDKVRQRSELRRLASSRGWSQAPKRFVVQEMLRYLGAPESQSDVLIANLITGVCRSNLPFATEKAKEAVETLKRHQQTDREEKEAAARAQERERRKREEEAGERRATAVQLSKEKLKNDFLALYGQADPQARGYALESFLSEVFELEGLKLRTAFKLIGEQIDGSFLWNGQTHLVEARWVKEPVAGNGFSSLIYKIGGKTANTRGLFVSVNGYSPEAVRGLAGKGELRFVCIDGAHLMRCLTPGFSLQALLHEVWRHADETGEPYLPPTRMRLGY